jgi:hypothetical protein
MNRSFLYVLPLLLVAIVFTSCSKDDDDDLLDINTQSVSTLALEDNWKVTYFFDDDDGDETSKFNGYTFTFTTAGQVTASLNGVDKTGIWIVRQDDGRTKLEVDFNDDDDPLDELDEDWVVTELTPNRIKLEDLDDDDDDDIEYLTLEKI